MVDTAAIDSALDTEIMGLPGPGKHPGAAPPPLPLSWMQWLTGSNDNGPACLVFDSLHLPWQSLRSTDRFFRRARFARFGYPCEERSVDQDRPQIAVAA